MSPEIEAGLVAIARNEALLFQEPSSRAMLDAYVPPEVAAEQYRRLIATQPDRNDALPSCFLDATLRLIFGSPARP